MTVRTSINMISLAMQGSKAPEQGSDEWHALRRKRMTGSKPANIMFEVKSKEDWDRVHEEFFGNRKPPPFSEEALARMDYGSKTEDIAAMCLLRNMPGSLFFECPLIPHPKYNWIAASPDGFLVQYETDDVGNILPELKVKKRYNIEIKCPMFELLGNPVEMDKKMSKKKAPPYYYMPQIHFEMVMNKVDTTLFVMYTPVRTHVWYIKFSNAYWRQTVDVLKCFKDRCCTWPYMKWKVNKWVRSSQRFAQKQKIWKVIKEP
jgi:hypothetical protein